MSAPGRPPLPDQAGRDLIRTALDRSLLVEAGAGSGKTTELVGRMVALVRDAGVAVERVAAVTFTRKAAGEMRERFQGALEEARREAQAGSPEAARLDTALTDVDRTFVGTIHAFCAKLLRERPLEAGLDPAFGELTAPQARMVADRWWNGWLERLAADGDPALAALQEIGLRPDQLQDTYHALNEHTDVDFPAPEVSRPDPEEIQAVREELDALMDLARPILPMEEPEDGWCLLQRALRSAFYVRWALDWDDDLVFLEAMAEVHAKATRITQKRWLRDGPLTAKVLKDAFEEWADDGSRASRLLRRWLAHRYPVALGFARRAAAEFAEHRRRTGQLTFHDLLVLTTRLLRRSRSARRDLGTRYRYVLVDEFQDTDPLQAEVLFLLASEQEGPRGAADGAEPDWRRAVPRPGALTVVGDPKQSIYRFRRADIALYEQVRRRFDGEAGGFGHVVVLTANFRSRPAIADVVNEVFASPERFPSVASERQAAFAPLEPQRSDEHPAEGVYVYDIPPCDDPRFKGRAREKPERGTEARALAAWIDARVRAGEREPGDFLLLSRTKRALALYAAALEARNLPVDVSGAGVGIEEELAELEIVLRALTDPDDPVRTVAALTGLFFGIDPERLLAFRTGGDRHMRGLDFRSVPVTAVGDIHLSDEGEYDGAGVPVAAALGTLHRWWRLAQLEPADVVVATVVDEAGLLPYAAAGELGQVRAGALAFALDAVRSAGLDRDTSLVGALEALESALDDDEVEAPLEPERSRAIRLMNLHKAKGLEGKVVVLVDPYASRTHAATLVVERRADGPATGWIRVGEARRFGSLHELARPLDWEDKEAAEAAFEEAEEARLLYVAATRARDELVVTRCGDSGRADKSTWTVFHPWLDRHGSALGPDAEEPPPRDHLDVEPDEIARRGVAAASRRAGADRTAFEFDTVTALTRREDSSDGATADERPPSGSDLPDRPLAHSPGDGTEERLGYAMAEADSTGPGGMEWGSVVHAVLEAAARDLPDESLRAAARTALLEHDRPVRDDEPVELGALMDLVARVRSSPLWTRAMAADIRLSEQPFVLERETGLYLEGVIDLVFKENGEWVIVDYKTDRGDDPDYGARMKRYEEQVELYGEAWAELTGETVKETLVWRVR